MRNPLTAMTQLADGIARSLPDSSDRASGEYLTIIEDNVDAAKTILACAAHQKRVIDDVLILTRLESRMLAITPVAERPSKVVSNTIKMFAGEASINDVTIEAARDHSYDSLQIDYVLIDTSRLTQASSHDHQLIYHVTDPHGFSVDSHQSHLKRDKIHSVVYGAQSQRPPQLTTSFGNLDWLPTLEQQEENLALPDLKDEEEKMYLYFCVQDTGTGMSGEEMKRLFKRFSQATSRTHITYGGSGIGLYICRQLAEKQGGGVGVAAKSNEGAVFAFYIEARAVEPSEIPPEKQNQDADLAPLIKSGQRTGLPSLVSSDSDSSRRGSTPRPEAPSATPPPPSPSILEPPRETFTILLVEDNLVNQRILAAQLRKASCTVLIANHGLEALQMLPTTDCWHQVTSGNESTKSSQGPSLDVILLDWEMPEMNGLECCKRIRELERRGQITRRMTIIAITANVRKEQLDQAMQAGMDSVMTKPFTCAALLHKINQMVNKKQGSP
nr:hybrid signal transduction histidine kinase k [Quercus suber]POF04895.1 hybrid signal transduction histidine kinase k [Quercus suber]